MNAEFSIPVEFTVEFESTGIALTVFFGEDADGDVYTFRYADMVQDLIDLSSFDAEDEPNPADLAYMRKVARGLRDALDMIDNYLEAHTAD